MAGPSVTERSRPKIIEDLVELGKKAFDPSRNEDDRRSGQDAFNQLLERTETFTIIPALNTLIKPGVLPSWLREPLMRTLTLLPLRPDGVRGTMEFVFSVHPSNERKTSDSAQPQKEGASITHEAVAVATRLLASVPSAMTADAWFVGISGQLFDLMDGKAGADLAKTAAQVVGFGILGKRQFGAPASPGWNAFVKPIIEHINPSANPTPRIDAEGDVEVIDLSKPRVIVRHDKLQQALQRLHVLVLSNPSPGLCKRLLKPVILQLWALTSWPSPSSSAEDKFVKPARSLVQTWMTLFGNGDNLMPLINNLLCNGSSSDSDLKWAYESEANDEIAIVHTKEAAANFDWSNIDSKASVLVDMMTAFCTPEEVSSIFLQLLRRWIETTQTPAKVKVESQDDDSDPESAIQDLVKVTILQKMMDKAPEKLVSHFDQLIELVCQVLRADTQNPLGEEITVVVLSLLNLVITAPSFHKSDIEAKELAFLEEALDKISERDSSDTAITARNLGMLLEYRDDVEPGGKGTNSGKSQQGEDQKTYKLALEYIMGGTDNPPPVVTEGLNLLSALITTQSTVLDITATITLLSSLLKDNEDFINLRVIKLFTQLATKHPRATAQELVDNYLDAQERLSTDVRLRFGEALLQVIERLGDTFTGEVAQQICETLLSIAGRRGHRPKAMKKQLREERMQKMKQDRGEVDDTEDDPILNEDGEEMTEEDKANNDVLAQILYGWESKRGSEDVRMRSSALSIFGMAIEINISGVGPSRVSGGVDLCLNVLAMEPEMEKAILRRAAIVVILSFVKALDDAKQAGRSLGFGLTEESRGDITRTLEYIRATDNDGLVRQHANDVVESLESWQMNSMLPSPREQSAAATSGLSRLAGLSVNPEGNLVDSSGRPRPRIEEIE